MVHSSASGVRYGSWLRKPWQILGSLLTLFADKEPAHMQGLQFKSPEDP
jgi:hypothetical protein